METQHSFCAPRVCAPEKHNDQQCVRNNVSSFARALRISNHSLINGNGHCKFCFPLIDLFLSTT